MRSVGCKKKALPPATMARDANPGDMALVEAHIAVHRHSTVGTGDIIVQHIGIVSVPIVRCFRHDREVNLQLDSLGKPSEASLSHYTRCLLTVD